VTSGTKRTVTGIRSECAANFKHLVWKKIRFAGCYVLPYFAVKIQLPSYMWKENGLLRGSSKLCEGVADVYCFSVAVINTVKISKGAQEFPAEHINLLSCCTCSAFAFSSTRGWAH
jgi:hypothetical protein